MIIQLHRWLRFRDIKRETESTIESPQDPTINTNYFKDKILEEEISNKCRLRKQHEEAIDHLTSGWPILAKNDYLMRHDRPGVHLQYSICKNIGKGAHTNIFTHTHTHTHTYTHAHTHTHTNHYVNMEMGECYGIKREFTANFMFL